jgi:hypothetical protein
MLVAFLKVSIPKFQARKLLLVTCVRNNGMVARELPLGPARLSCIYVVFAPYLTLPSICIHTVHTSLQSLYN